MVQTERKAYADLCQMITPSISCALRSELSMGNRPHASVPLSYLSDLVSRINDQELHVNCETLRQCILE